MTTGIGNKSVEEVLAEVIEAASLHAYEQEFPRIYGRDVAPACVAALEAAGWVVVPKAEAGAAALLRRLFEAHFYNNSRGGVAWSYIEDTALDDVDPELDAEIRAMLEARPR